MRAFGAILQHPGALVMSASALVGRFPIAMLGLALTLLVVAETGSYARAGAVAALLTVGGAVGGPLSSRLADRHGQDRVLPPLVALHVVAVAALTAAVQLIEAAVPAARLTEALALGIAGIQLGFAAAAALAGALIDWAGPSAGLAVGSLAAGTALLLVLVVGRRLAGILTRQDAPVGRPGRSAGGTAPPG
jgi:MFS family permease